MSDIHLTTDLKNLRVCPQGPATAGIWLTFGDSAFPQRMWTDFIVKVLAWWAHSLIRVLRGDVLNAKVHFMDGPFLVELSMINSERLTFKMFDDAYGNHLVATGEAPCRQFLAEIVTQSRLLLAECRSRGWWSSDADILSQCIDDLNREQGGPL